MLTYRAYDDEELLSLLRTGDEAAFTEIYNRYWNKLYFLAHKHLKSATATEEIVQDVFLIIWKKRETLDIHSLSLYLAAMTRYTVYRYLAKQKNYKEMALSGMQTEPGADREEEIDNKLLLGIIEKLSDRLPEKCRFIFIHNKLLDQPLKQVAEELNISQKTAEAHLTKALKNIRDSLGKALAILFIL